MLCASAAIPNVEAVLSTTVGEFADNLADVDDQTKPLSFVATRYQSFAASLGTDFFVDMCASSAILDARLPR